MRSGNRSAGKCEDSSRSFGMTGGGSARAALGAATSVLKRGGFDSPSLICDCTKLRFAPSVAQLKRSLSIYFVIPPLVAARNAPGGDVPYQLTTNKL